MEDKAGKAQESRDTELDGKGQKSGQHGLHRPNLQKLRGRVKLRGRFLDQLYNVGLYQNRIVQLKCEKNAGQNKSIDQKDRADQFPGDNVRLLKKITVNRCQKENVKTFQGMKIEKVVKLIFG